MSEYRTIQSRLETPVARTVTAVVLAAALAGCAAQGGGQAIRQSEPTFMRLTEERVFAQALRQRYLELATHAYDRADFTRSDFYSLRAIMAVEGKLVEPAGAGVKGDPALDAARVRLGRSIARGARTGAPELAARAQAGYDCWWLESQAGGDAAVASACAANTAGVLSRLDAIGTGLARSTRPAGSRRFVIDGDTPSQTVDMDGARVEVLRQRAAAPRAPAPVRAAPVAPSPAFAPPPAFVPPQSRPAPLAPLPPLPVEPARRSLPDFPQGTEALEDVPSLRTFTIEPAPAAADTYVQTVPFPASPGPVDLIPDYEAVLPFAPARGGQYVDIGEDSFPAPVVPTVPFAPPVYSDAGTAPLAAAPAAVMMEQSGDVLSTLLEARTRNGADFSVYFGFDSAEITPEGQDVLVDALEQIALGDRGTVSLMGFTDSAGDSRYNQLLAMRRANAVRSFIQQRANRPVRFEIMPVGEAEAVRNGGDGVTEALNRRVEIVLR